MSSVQEQPLSLRWGLSDCRTWSQPFHGRGAAWGSLRHNPHPAQPRGCSNSWGDPRRAFPLSPVPGLLLHLLQRLKRSRSTPRELQGHRWVGEEVADVVFPVSPEFCWRGDRSQRRDHVLVELGHPFSSQPGVVFHSKTPALSLGMGSIEWGSSKLHPRHALEARVTF